MEGNNKCRCEEIGTLKYFWWKCKNDAVAMETTWHFLKRLNIELPHNPAIPLLSIDPKQVKTDV